MAKRKTQVGRTKAQRHAEHLRAVAGGRAEAAKRRKFGATKAQKAAGKRWAAGGRAAQASARARAKAGLQPLKHKAKLSAGDVSCCAARAVCDSLTAQSGLLCSDEDVLGLYWRVAVLPDEGAALGDVLAAAHSAGVAGRYARYGPARDLLYCAGPVAAGLLVSYASWDGGEAHAALSLGGGHAWSWGEVSGLPGLPDEAWWVSWG
jgi:hypothetical protein